MSDTGADAGHLDLGYDPDQVALADTVAQWAARHATDEAVRAAVGTLPAALWSQLADLGVLGLGTPEGGGGALEIAAAMEVLGGAVVPGPLVGTFMANQLLDEEQRRGVGAGKAVVAVGAPPLVPWAPVADVFVELAGDGDDPGAWLATPAGPIEAVETLGGEPWGRVELTRVAPLGSADDVRRAATVGDVAVAAYLVGAAERLVGATTEWAKDRRQFGRSIGEFQSVAHPLADVAIRTSAARNLTRLAAYAADHTHDRTRPTDARASAAVARLSATRAAVDATYRAHQAFGALGYTVEGPVALVGQRVRQVSLHPPGPRAARATALTPYDL